MHLTQLTLCDFRLFSDAQFHFHPHINHITGANGAGKTALLEAIYTLGRGKSFRENKTQHVIQHGKAHYQIIAKLEDTYAQKHVIGMEKSQHNHKIKHNGESIASLSALSKLLPLDIINSDKFALINQSPDYRRRYLNYGLFYYDQAFLPAWQRYQHALKNRNAALRAKWSAQHIRIFHQPLSEEAEKIAELTAQYLDALSGYLNDYHVQLGGNTPIMLHYKRGWHEQLSLAKHLDTHLERDYQLKHTKDGIHRADLRFYNEHGDIAHYFSRGEQKTLIAALILAQNTLISQRIKRRPIILIDDIGAELDQQRQNHLIHLLTRQKNQLFITQIKGETVLTLPEESMRIELEKGQWRVSASL